MSLSYAVHAIVLCAVFFGTQGTAFDAGAQVRPRDVNREPAREREPRERNFPERDFPEPDPDPDPPPASGGRAQPQLNRTPMSPSPAAQRDPALVVCDGLRSELESVIRQEMKGGSAATIESLRAKRQSIYQEQLRAGC